MIYLIRLLLHYDQQIHTCLMSDHQRVMVKFILTKYSHYTSFLFKWALLFILFKSSWWWRNL